MEFLDHGTEASTGHIEEFEARLEGGRLFVRVAGVNWFVPYFPDGRSARLKLRMGTADIHHCRIALNWFGWTE